MFGRSNSADEAFGGAAGPVSLTLTLTLTLTSASASPNPHPQPHPQPHLTLTLPLSLPLTLSLTLTKQAIPRVAELMAQHLGWSKKEKSRQIKLAEESLDLT